MSPLSLDQKLADLEQINRVDSEATNRSLPCIDIITPWYLFQSLDLYILMSFDD